MADSTTCFMQPFSYISGFNNEPNQGNPMHALGESVSFGRFVSESLSWEKWSSFSQNRYVEEAERYAQPGSVAQKKAFFEAHYKRIAEAKKAAALLEQTTAANNSSELELESGVLESTPHESQAMPQLLADEQQEVKNECIADAKRVQFENVEAERAYSVTTDKNLSTTSKKDNEALNNLDLVSGSELSVGSEMEKPLLKCSFSRTNEEISRLTSERKPIISSSKSSVNYRKASKVSPSPTKQRAPLHPRRENNVTPVTKVSTIETFDWKKSNPKSLRMLMNSASGREQDKDASSFVKITECSKITPAYKAIFKASKDCATPLKTPTTAAMNGIQKHCLATPCSENRRVKTPLHPLASGSKTTGPKWHALSSACSKSLSACRKKLQSSGLSSPFILRTEERAAKRKQKLEEKFNAKEAQKVQSQTKFKEKAETEVRKLRQSLCFKARPLPNFYSEKEIPENQIKKTPQARPQSPKLGRNPSRSTTQSKLSATPVSSTKNRFSKTLLKKNGQAQTPIHPLVSVPRMNNVENRSPNDLG